MNSRLLAADVIFWVTALMFLSEGSSIRLLEAKQILCLEEV